MSDRETLLSTLPKTLHDDAAKLYEGVQEPDPHDVIVELHRRGLLDDEGVKTAVLELQGALRVGRMRSTPPSEHSPSILGPLGAGAMGEVLLAKDESLGRIVAIKRLLPQLATRPAVVERFYREAQITAQLDHPSIVPIHGLNTEGGLSYTMKLVQGRTFEAYLEEVRGAWKQTGTERGEHMLPARLEHFLHVVDAVAYAHERGVIHRDLKPENVMVGTFGQVQLMDWGIAKILAKPEEQGEVPPGQQAPRSPNQTRAGSVFGTPRYMSPEQASGQNDRVDARADQYALGLMLFEIVTLKPAIPGVDVESCLAWAREAKKQPMTHLFRKGAIPVELVAITNKATAKDPAKRYPNVAAMGEDIRRYLRDEAVLAKPDTLTQRSKRWVGHHRSTVVALGMLAAVFFSGSLVLLGSSAIAVIEWQRRAAEAHEDTVAALLAEAQREAADVDRLLRGAEKGLVGLSYAVVAILDGLKGELPEIAVDPFDEGIPGKAQKSSLYGKRIALDRLTLTGSKPSDPTDATWLFINPYAFLQVLLDSSGGDEPLDKRERTKLIAETGVPVRWARFATAEGLLVTMPGTETSFGTPATSLPWYRADTSTHITWTGPAPEPDGTELVFTAARPVSNKQRKQLGTAAIDLSAAALVKLLDPPEWIDEVWLVDEAGRVMLWNGMSTTGPVQPRVLPDPALAPLLKVQRSGYYETDGHVAVWSAIDALADGQWRLVMWADGDVWREVKTNRPGRY